MAELHRDLDLLRDITRLRHHSKTLNSTNSILRMDKDIMIMIMDTRRITMTGIKI